MGKFIALLVLVGLIGWGIHWMTSQPPTPAPKTGFEGYTGALKMGEEKAQRVLAQDRLMNVKDAVEKYRVEKDVYPPSLQAVVDAGLLDNVPPGLAYDPATGQVSVAP